MQQGAVRFQGLCCREGGTGPRQRMDLGVAISGVVCTGEGGFGGRAGVEGAGGGAVGARGRGEEVVEGEDGVGEVRREFPLLGAVDGGAEGVVEVEPVVGGGWLGEERVVLEGLEGVCGEAVWDSRGLGSVVICRLRGDWRKGGRLGDGREVCTYRL